MVSATWAQMKKRIGMKKTILIILTLALASGALAQTKTEGGLVIVDESVALDKVVNDFGDVMASDGPLKCTFIVTNISGQPMAIYNVVTSCGCTNVTWTREPLQPGGKGTISATYSNDEGPYPFDKTLTAYFSNTKKPVILRLRGSVHAKKQPLSELYPVHFGPLGLKTATLKNGNLSQGSERSDAVSVANLSSKPITVSLKDISPFMTVGIVPNPIPAGGTAKLTFTVKADRSLWGKNWYYMTPLVDGKRVSAMEGGAAVSKISVWAFTKEDFSGMSKAEKDASPQPLFNESSFNFGSVKAGTPVEAVFKVKNEGKAPLHIYKADPDNAAVKTAPLKDIPAGRSGEYHFALDTSTLPQGEALIVVALVTNSPLRPIINLFIAGKIR